MNPTSLTRNSSYERIKKQLDNYLNYYRKIDLWCKTNGVIYDYSNIVFNFIETYLKRLIKAKTSRQNIDKVFLESGCYYFMQELKTESSHYKKIRWFISHKWFFIGCIYSKLYIKIHKNKLIKPDNAIIIKGI